MRSSIKQLDPKSVWLFFISFVLQFFVLILVVSIVSVFQIIGNNVDSLGAFSFGSLPSLWLILSIVLVFCFVWAKLTYHFYRYELTDAGFCKEFGVIYKKYVTIPYDRIQNIDIDRGILARILGLSDLSIQTAGASMSSSSSEGKLPALSQKIAEQLRDELLQRARKSKNQGL